jgi:cobalt-zinc-cadmium efflux system outer membrane protein
MKQAARDLYPSLPPLPEDPKTAPGPEGRPLTLSDLQRLAVGNHPSIKNAAAGVEAARGAVRQAGAYPNPSVFWEADTVGTSGAGYQGAGFDQPIKSANKLKLQKAAATIDLRNAELALRRAETDVMYGVRTNYFAVLVALENIKVSRALAEFTERVFRVQVELLAEGGFAAPYEPMQLRPLVLGARFNLLQAIKQYEASWRQLAASVGIPGLPPTSVSGRVDMPIPLYRYGDVLVRALAQHTDMLTAQNALQKARYQLELAQVTPYPDFDIRSLIQKDYTTPPHFLVYSIAVTLPVPIWDQNKGAIQQAYNQMLQAAEGPHQIQVNLTNSLAEAINRYEANREQVRITWQQIQDQVRAYRGLYERRETQPDQVAFGDVVTAEQTLATYIAAYVTALGAQWLAVADVANVLQTDDLFQTNQLQEMPPVPDLEHLLALPCCHPCGTLPQSSAQPAESHEGSALPAAPTPAASNLAAPRPGPGPVFPETLPEAVPPLLHEQAPAADGNWKSAPGGSDR